jgi:hypothetical protein
LGVRAGRIGVVLIQRTNRQDAKDAKREIEREESRKDSPPRIDADVRGLLI